jgi:phosphomannomutase/phosphoglucomutase
MLMNKAKGSSPDSASSTRKLALPPLALDWHRWLPLAGGTMLLVIAAFFAWQTSQILRDSAAKDQLVRERDRMSVSLAEFIAEMRAAVTTALATPGLAETAAIPDPTARQNAIAMLRQALPESTNAELYSTEMGEVLSSDFRRFGYSKAAQLMKARSSPAPVQTISIGKAGRVLSFAEPVVVGGQTVAIAWIEMPLQPLLDRFEQANLGPGRLELHQGDGNNDLVLDGVGTSGPQDVVPDRGIVIEGTAFRVATRPPDVFIVGPRNPLLYAVLAIIFAVSGWLSLWLRKVGVRVGIRRLSSRLGAKEVDVSNMTMAEALQKAPASARPVVRPGAPPRPRMPPPGVPSAPVSVDRSIFRAYDIRGVLGKTLNADVARMIGRAIVSEGVERG